MAVALAAATLGPAAAAVRAPAGAATTRVIVQSSAGEGAAAAVEAAGGRVTRTLDLVHGVAATMPAGGAATLARSPGLVVTPDVRVRVQGDVAPAPAGTSVYGDVVGASALRQAGNRGDGVTVAVIDTGISAVPDLAGRIVPVRDDPRNTTSSCLNLSGEQDCTDSYGHGTFMAGIIAGSGASSAGRYTGMAPGARLVSVKIAGRDGSADVSTVLAAIEWVVSFKDRYGIRVLNLSLGTDSTQSYRTDPLNYAVERAWAAGIAVVVAASNRGPAAGTISKPGDDPWVITVGAIDDRGTAPLDDDHLPDFSSRGPTAADGLAKPDVAAPGAHVVSLSAPGSDIAQNFPSAVGGGYQVGSGTSMATAVVSGAAALLVKADPSITPDRLKFALMSTARPGPVPDPAAVGAGTIDAVGAISAPTGTANHSLARSNGLGSLDASRGTVRVHTTGLLTTSLTTSLSSLLGLCLTTTLFGTLVSGMQTAQLLTWDPIGFTGSDWGPTTWYASNFYRSQWYQVAWDGSKWQGSKWQGGADTTTTYGSKWQGADWYGAWG